VLFNTVVSRRGIALGSGKPLKPRDCVVAFNVVSGAGDLLTEQPGTVNARFLTNIVHGGDVDVSEGAWRVDPALERAGDIFRIAATSPAVDAAEPTFEVVSEDIAGKPRTQPDLGAHELSDAPARYRMLGEADVGPLAP
jgi:hypothetical protein